MRRRGEDKGKEGRQHSSELPRGSSKSCQVLLPKALRDQGPECPGQNRAGPAAGTTVLRVSHGGSDNPAGPGAAVHLGVFGQVVTAGKLLLAERTLVGLDAGVRAAVARQLVRTGEPWGTRGRSQQTAVENQ